MIKTTLSKFIEMIMDQHQNPMYYHDVLMDVITISKLIEDLKIFEDENRVEIRFIIIRHNGTNFLKTLEELQRTYGYNKLKCADTNFKILRVWIYKDMTIQYREMEEIELVTY